VPGPTLEPNPLVVKHKGALTEITLTFSEQMNIRSLTDINNYTLIDAGPDHIFGNKNDRGVKIRSATAMGSDAVTLVLKKPDKLKDSIRLTINAQPSSGLESSGGKFLNSTASGAAGANDVIYFGKAPKPPKPAKKGKKPNAVVLDRHAGARLALHREAAAPIVARAAGPALPLQPWFIDSLLERAGKTGHAPWRA
jgi:hypothetical protein